ncbi:Protein phosphatase [Abortiporus biennis]
MKIHSRFPVRARPLAPAAVSSSPTSSQGLPRIRSNSASSSRSLHTVPFSFFDAPPAQPPSSRPSTTNLAASPRVVVEAKPESESHSPYQTQSGPPQTQASHSNPNPPPYPLALTSGQSDSSSSSNFMPNASHTIFFPYPSLAPIAYVDTSSRAHAESSVSSSSSNRTKYHLDVGAYGIPKNSRGVRVAGGTSAQAVQVGEDAYFLKENAMGVADGVGGWSKLHKATRPEDSTPSALFAQRLMHYCCEEVEAASSHEEENAVFDDHDDQVEEDPLEDLTDGLDVLMILERAYDKTMKAHVVDPSSSDSLDSEYGSPPLTTPPGSNTKNSASSSSTTSGRPVPLLQGSATALLAILDNPPSPPSTPSPSFAAHPSSSASSSPSKHGNPLNLNSDFTSPNSIPRQYHSIAPTLLNPRPRYPIREHDGVNAVPRTEVVDRGAVIRIAHLGDCMGMLIRGDQVVWRSEEMWWNFNTPLQLGPSSPTRPRDAKIFTIPVQKDDILVLASDGLSDNLWDEDILDEVVRMRKGFMGSRSSSSSSSSSDDSILGRKSLAGMLSEALCSRARCVSEKRGSSKSSRSKTSSGGVHKVRSKSSSTTGRGSFSSTSSSSSRNSTVVLEEEVDMDEIPFARRAREMGKLFQGGKPDDISVLIAVVSPNKTSSPTATTSV